MNVKFVVCAATTALSLAFAAMAEPPATATTTVEIGERDQALLVAMADAQASFGDFWTVYTAQPDGTDRFALKVGLVGADGAVDHIWVTKPRRENGMLFGQVKGLPNDGEAAFTERDITDWGFAEGPRLRGHFTTRALMTYMDPVDAEHVASLLHADPLPLDGALNE